MARCDPFLFFLFVRPASEEAVRDIISLVSFVENQKMLGAKQPRTSAKITIANSRRMI